MNTQSRPALRRPAHLVAALLAVLLAVLATETAVAGPAPTLPLGDADLAEVRSSRTLAPGVRLIKIVRGTKPAARRQIPTTTRGPWRVYVLRIDPRRATGRLRATYGADLAGTETVAAMARRTGAVAAVNGSFFTHTASRAYPGDPVGLGLYAGALLSEPSSAAPAEVDLLVDSRTNSVTMDRLAWSGRMTNRRTGAFLQLEFLNHPPVVPARCVKLGDPTRCRIPGDVVHLTRELSRTTPSGKGVEVVLGRTGCVVSRTRFRGTTLHAGQTSVQATGAETDDLLAISRGGCFSRSGLLTRPDGSVVERGPWLHGVNGRFRLVADGEVVVPAGRAGDHFFDRHPRTVAGRTGNGTVVLAAIDGRQTTSVGTTLAETAAVAQALGMRDAVNLDGGGSTTMVAAGKVVNSPSDGDLRPVGDALVYLPR